MPGQPSPSQGAVPRLPAPQTSRPLHHPGGRLHFFPVTAQPPPPSRKTPPRPTRPPHAPKLSPSQHLLPNPGDFLFLCLAQPAPFPAENTAPPDRASPHPQTFLPFPPPTARPEQLPLFMSHPTPTLSLLHIHPTSPKVWRRKEKSLPAQQAILFVPELPALPATPTNDLVTSVNLYKKLTVTLIVK